MISSNHSRTRVMLSALVVLALLASVYLLAGVALPGRAANSQAEDALAITPGQNAAIFGAHILLLEGQQPPAIYLPLISN